MSDGEYDWEGLLYVRIKGEERGVCQNEFDQTDARVACQQLGFADAFSFNPYEMISSNKYWLDNLQCTGSEEKLCQCPSNGIGQVDNCGTYDGVRVTCKCKLCTLL